ncbi:alpha-1,3-mannosyltransferase CMT1 [Thelonectria olida]|uniref:Alpha-1,3-mannosyltransferase CMT1 n=1 Tax=Thelonectria olida TaxID=1576542 RepID=A0A9P8W6X5_9HYPO|nr:alpha-1,3-mannosyltransferase CMT1 [Thelonectria olida]
MNRRLLWLLVPALCFIFLATSLYVSSEHLTQLPDLHLQLPFQQNQNHNSSSSSPLLSASLDPTTSSVSKPTAASSTISLSPPSATPSPQPTSISNGAILSADRISPYIRAILDPLDTNLPRLECPALNTSRYDTLRQRNHTDARTNNHIDYYFALDLRNCLGLLPRLLGSIVEAIRFLGPHRCALSIVEGNSPDGTADILIALRPFLSSLGASYFYQSSKIDPSKGDRIRRLADLRNLALTPLLDNSHRASGNTTIVFINDVAACTEDSLELVLQRRWLGADMTCAMDWTYVGPDPTFYDVWVARTIHGDAFFEVPPDGSWNSAWNLFWNAPETGARYDAHLPFQVFACWNGATAIGAAPVLDGLRFRDNCGGKDGECYQGEPQIFCKEMWFRNFGKIAVIPTVNLEYSDEMGAEIKQLKGYTGDFARDQTMDGNKIDWELEPPDQVKCMPTWDNQSWRPWNETLNATLHQ